MPEFASDGMTIGLILFAAILHATWNALTKASVDPVVNIAVVTATGGVVAIPVMLMYPIPEGDVWTWLLLSAAIHFVYELGLARMYRLGELSQVYPIARGLAPLGVATLGAVYAGEMLEHHQVAGLGLSGAAIVWLGRAGAREPGTRQAVGTALVVALLIGLYTFSDGRGVREVAEPIQFISWSFFLGCLPFSIYAIIVRRHTGMAALRTDGLRAIGGGLMATLGYGIALWAMSRTPMALVSSLRESSVLFAALIGAGLLGDRFGRQRIAAAALLVMGLILVQLRGF